MNAQQRRIIKGALVAVVASIMFPPFHFVTDNFTVGLGFGFIFWWPNFHDRT